MVGSWLWSIEGLLSVFFVSTVGLKLKQFSGSAISYSTSNSVVTVGWLLWVMTLRIVNHFFHRVRLLSIYGYTFLLETYIDSCPVDKSATSQPISTTGLCFFKGGRMMNVRN